MKKTNKPFFFLVSVTIFAILIGTYGCSKERIVESTEYIHDTKYIELPPDTVMIFDTVFTLDSVTIERVDTLVVTNIDTVLITDTVIQIEQIYDTVVVYDTTISYLTIYDTTVIVDTIQSAIFDPNESTAFAALQKHSDPLVMIFINVELGLTDGWIYYLSILQSSITERSVGVYDIAGYVDFWALDWSGYYPLEYFWEIRYNGGDPANAANWTLGEPAYGSPGQTPGISRSAESGKVAVPLQP